MPTLNSAQILAMTVDAFKVRFPFLLSILAQSVEGAQKPVKLGDIRYAHIRLLPTVQDYDPVTGYANGATEIRNLLKDVPIEVKKHKHAPVMLSHLNAIADRKNELAAHLADCAYVLGKYVADDVLGLGLRNSAFTNTVTDSIANTDRDSLSAICELMNLNGAVGTRIGVVGSQVMTSLFNDPEISSKLYYGQLPNGTQLRVIRDVEGFSAIYEYPGLSDGNAASGTFTAATTDICTKTAHGFLTGDKVRVSSTTTLPAGLAAATTYYVIKLTADTFKLATSDANAVAGTAVDITDTGTGTHSIVGYENTTGLFFTNQAMMFLSGIPDDSAAVAQQLGIPLASTNQAYIDADTQLAMMMIASHNGLTQNVNATQTMLWGSCAGRQTGGNGGTGSLLDKAAVRLISA